ncbi:SLC13 family permease [Lysobacter oculi]|uniref:SLC13 family permease n=1 Tax=Solilutibacter oculi TaxID=2698682 RepID=A0A344J2V2_9GAMM|nr:SLC13 family permease [Lysobacter oculi]AXA83362.1 SLC13 family permease [Lysobacter oculi]
MDTALTLTTDMKLVLGLVALTMGLFLFDRLRPDLVALVVLVLLGLTGLVAPEDLFGGFAGNAVISIIATMILGAGLERTGALNRLAGWLLRRADGSERRLLLYTSAMAGLNSSLMQNPSVMALYLPVASRLSARTGVALSRMLLPIAAAIIMGGALTMVGNSPLILLNDLLVSANANLPSGAVSLKPLKMFAPLPIGLALVALSLVYFRWRGDRLLSHDDDGGVTPARTQSYFAQAYGIEGEVYELTVGADSPLVGMTLGEAEILPGAPMVLALKSSEEARLAPSADQRIWVGDVLGVMGQQEAIAQFSQANFLRMNSRLRQFAELFNPSRAGIAEAVIPPNSRFIGKTASELQLRKKYRLSLLAVNRDKEVIRDDARKLPLRAGDMLVLHSFWRSLGDAGAKKDFVVVTDYPKGEQRPHKFKIAMGIFAVTMLIALSSRIPVPIALMTGVAGMLLAGVINMDEAYASINWKTVFLMACLIPLGWAMDSSGAAAWVAGHTIDQIPTGTPLWLIEVALAVLTVSFSLVVSHVGATIMMVPLAINLALAANGNPMVFALIVALSASNNFMTATNPVISMVVGPGNYSARDLWRIGLPLSALYTALIVLMVNLLW